MTKLEENRVWVGDERMPDGAGGYKSERRAFFVLGPEGSGTYCLTEALVAAGCHWEQWHESYHDDYKFPEMQSPFVIHRSLPHAGHWPDIRGMLVQMDKTFEEIIPLFIIRDFNATAKSVHNRDTTRNIPGLQNSARKAFRHFIEAVDPHWFDFIYITYESFCLSEGFRRWLFQEKILLPYPEDYEVTDQNRQYYE